MDLSTVLPLIGIDYDLLGQNERLSLGKGFFITGKTTASKLAIFDDDYLRSELSEKALSQIETTNYYLGVSEQLSSDLVPNDVVEKCNERLDRFLLSLNLNGKLWSFRPDIRMSWVEQDEPKNREFFRIRHASPISTFENKPALEDFRAAANLTRRIDEIYESGDKNYPALKTAFDAVRLSAYAFNTAMRFLQLATALETLCSTATTEVAHRVATTCSILVGNNAQDPEKEQRRMCFKKWSV
jgi:hypothetical protein